MRGARRDKNEGGRGFWAAIGMRVAMGEDGGESATEAEGTVEGRAYEVVAQPDSGGTCVGDGVWCASGWRRAWAPTQKRQS